MERLGLVATTFGARGWRAYTWPVLSLLAATVAIGLIRTRLDDHPTVVPPAKHAVVHKAHVRHPGRAVYVIRAGDTIAAISAKAHVPAAKLLALNPSASPTALFIGEKIRLR